MLVCHLTPFDRAVLGFPGGSNGFNPTQVDWELPNQVERAIYGYSTVEFSKVFNSVWWPILIHELNDGLIIPDLFSEIDLFLLTDALVHFYQ